MFAHLSLADHAASINNRLYINGGGWNVRPPFPVPWAITVELRVPWHDNNRSFPFVLELLDADGQPIELETPNGLEPVAINTEVRLTAGPGLPPGSQIVGVGAFLLQPIPLAPGQLFEWRLSIDGATRDEWRVSFATTKQEPPRAEPKAA